MNDQAAFLRSICIDPADDAPRLIFSDWLEGRAADVECPTCSGEKYVDPFHGGPYKSYKRYIMEPPRPECPTYSGTGSVSNGFAERAEFMRYESTQAALDALSLACITYGRAAVGLTPLVETCTTK